MLNRPRDEKLGCLFLIVGGAVGFFLGVWSFDLHMARMRAMKPDYTGDGLAALAGMFWGGFFGSWGGLMFGVILDRLLPTGDPVLRLRRSKSSDSPSLGSSQAESDGNAESS